MQLKPGSKLFSTTSPAQLVVVKAPPHPVDLRCGGAPMVLEDPGPTGPGAGGISSGATVGLLLGKRYTDPTGGIELLCTRPGSGPLTCDGDELALKEAKPLPASD